MKIEKTLKDLLGRRVEIRIYDKTNHYTIDEYGHFFNRFDLEFYTEQVAEGNLHDECEIIKKDWCWILNFKETRN